MQSRPGPFHMKTSLTLALSLLAAPLFAQQAAGLGDQVPDFAFPKLLNGDGRQNLAEFFGQPVVIDFWGTR